MRIRIIQYDAKADAPADPGKESFRTKELRFLKVMAVVLAAVTLFGGTFLYLKTQCIYNAEGLLKSVEPVYSGTKYHTLSSLDLLIDDTLYHLYGDYIHNDGGEYRTDHIKEMWQLLESDKMLMQPIRIQYLQLTRYDRPIIIDAVCGNVSLLNGEYSMQVRKQQLYFDLLLGSTVFAAFLGAYWFRKRYSINIDKSTDKKVR